MRISKFLKISSLILLFFNLKGSLAGNCWGVESSRGSNTTRSELNNSQLGSDRGSAVGSGNAASDVGSERDVVSPHYETSASHGHTEKCPCREFNIEDFDKNETIIKNEHQKIELRVRKGEDNEIGKGGFGKIYHAIRGNGCVALKVYDLVDEEVRRQAVNEIEILKELKGKNGIIKYYGSEINKEHRKAFIVMELGAMNLHKYIKEIKNNGIEGDELDKETLKVVIEAARALEKFHNYGGIHLDIKPSNFVVMKDHDNILIVKLIDFGLSYLLKQGHETINLERKFPGTKGYRAPEIFNMNNKVTFKADIYSFGVLIYRLVYKLEEEFSFYVNENGFLDSREKIINSLKYHGHRYTTKDYLHDEMMRCTEHDPRERPSLSQVIEMLVLVLQTQ
ncbi:hypothetical protein ACQ4LE_009334 [Meloidogyne hapla]